MTLPIALTASDLSSVYLGPRPGAPGEALDAMRPRVVFSYSEYELICEDTETRVHLFLKEAYPHIYGSLEKEDLYKLIFMERKDHEKGRFGFDSEETNYYYCMLNAYEFMLKTLDSPLSVDLYQALHDVCCYDIRTLDSPGGIPMGYRVIADGAEAFQVIKGSTLSEAGYNELVDKYKNTTCIFEDQTYFPFKGSLINPAHTIDLTGKELSFIKVKPIRLATAKFYVQFALDRFEKAPKTTDDEKLFAIAALCQDLDQFHVFVDGNIRTTGILVLNKMLISLKLSPSVLNDVNVLDCLSVLEIVEKIKEGQSFFQALIS
jgi:hypothetical protein